MNIYLYIYEIAYLYETEENVKSETHLEHGHMK